MIFILTVIIMCARYIKEVDDSFNSEDAKQRPWAYDHTAAMGASIGFIFILIKSLFYGAFAESMFWIVITMLTDILS